MKRKQDIFVPCLYCTENFTEVWTSLAYCEFTKVLSYSFTGLNLLFLSAQDKCAREGKAREPPWTFHIVCSNVQGYAFNKEVLFCVLLGGAMCVTENIQQWNYKINKKIQKYFVHSLVIGSGRNNIVAHKY